MPSKYDLSLTAYGWLVGSLYAMEHGSGRVIDMLPFPWWSQEWCKNGSVFDIIRKAELELKDGPGPHCDNWQVVSCTDSQ